MKPYSMDLRQRIAAAIDHGEGVDFPTNGERGVKGYPARSYSTGDR
jgi:hypothetical protein